MIRGNTPWQPLDCAQINWAEGASPHSPRFDDYYYSSQDGLEESRYVFLQGNRLPARFLSHAHPSFHIVETGFGTGLNFLLSWQLWRQQALPRPRLHYTSIEKYPLARDDMRRALASWPALAELAALLLDNYPQPIPGQHRILLEDGAVVLDLWWEDAQDAVAEMASYQQKTVDAWYLDGFTPNRNPEMWTDKLFNSLAQTSRTGATFATFTAAGKVRRALLNVGFEVFKLSGYGKKRECMRGELRPSSAALSHRSAAHATPWDIDLSPPSAPQSVIIIGAGIAGCTTARALANRDINVCVLDACAVANAGSGNEQGVLYTRLSRKHSPLSDFSLQSYQFALRFYQQLFASGALRVGIDGELCGAFHQSDKMDDMAALAPLLQLVPGLASVLSAADANTLLGVEQNKGGYWYPGSGWLHPGAVCHALLQHRNIRLLEHTGKLALEQRDKAWVAMHGDKVLAQADCVVIAAGIASASLCKLEWLPLQAIRGQTTGLPASEQTRSLRAALCHKGYIAPARLGEHCIGATFDTKDDDARIRIADHRKNLDTLGVAVPAWQGQLSTLDEQALAGRVGYRCASPDYLPLVGPVPDRTLFLQNYGSLRKNARRIIPRTGEFIPGVYLTTGHGSRGLTSTPLAAEILASAICDEPMPLSRELHRALAPARFIIRDLKRKNA